MNIQDEVAAGISKGLAALGMGGGKPNPGPTAPPSHSFTPEQLGVLSVALALGIDTPEKLTALHTDSKKDVDPVLKAAMELGIDTPEKLTALHTASKQGELAERPVPPHPVLTAALAAGCDTAEKFTQLAGEAKAGREALPGAREEAEAGAVAYFGADDPVGLQAAKDLIAEETSFNRLNSLTEKYWSGAPGATRPEKRLSQPGSPSPTDQKNAAQKEKDLAASGDSLSASAPFDYYAQFNGKKVAS